jgi:hypothetical protein
MELPKITNKNVSHYLNGNDVVLETAAQIMKDFGLFGMTISFSGNTDNAYNELHQQLIEQIAILLVKDYQRLLSVLYQVDISEKDIAQTELEFPNYNHIEVIAHQIIVRDLKKVLTRHYYKSKL